MMIKTFGNESKDESVKSNNFNHHRPKVDKMCYRYRLPVKWTRLFSRDHFFHFLCIASQTRYFTPSINLADDILSAASHQPLMS